MKMVQESRNHKEQINQSIIKLSSSLQRSLNTESLTSMQINNRKQSGKKGSKCRHLGLFLLHLCRVWRRHILEGELFTRWGSATWKCCVGVCVYICVEGIFRMEKKKCNFSGQQTESFHDNLSNISSVNHTILAFHACWLRREIMPFTSGDFLLSVCILIRSSKLILSYTNRLDI